MGSKELIEKELTKQIVNGEYTVAQSNQQLDNEDFESYVDLLDSVRSSKNYDWMSDIRIPEFASHWLTQTSLDVDQYFQTRDFVEVYLEDEGDEAKLNSEATKELINRTLNQKYLNHYQKFVRSKSIANLVGKVYLKCWWEQETIYDQVGEEEILEELDVDDFGNPLRFEGQTPARRFTTQPVFDNIPLIDRFNYDVYDQRNVFTDNTYRYSIQDKQWIIFRDEPTLQELKDEEESNGYFNLDILEEGQKPDSPSQTADETYNKDSDNPHQTVSSSIEKRYDRLERYGKFWVVLDRDEKGIPVEGSEKIGLDQFGKPLENAELHEVIITIILHKSTSTLIGFRLTPFLDAQGIPYRPIVRGLCYLHPTQDGGVGDGKYTRELQIAIDDTFNISQDRTMLATLPTFKTKKYSLDGNSTVYIEPMHAIELEDPNDMTELVISDNIAGALNQMGVLTTKMQQVDAIQPPSMGQVPSLASTTATAASLANQGTSVRSSYKSMTFEYTALADLYWMIQQMTYTFALPETGFKLMGEKVYNFDPSKDYYFKPLSQSIETEQSKALKRKEWTTLLSYIIQMQHPDTVRIVNYILGEITKLMGDEYQNFSDKFLNEQTPIQQQGQQLEQQGSGLGPSNQAGVQQSPAEIMTREGI